MSAVHELTAEHMDAMLDFFEDNAVADVAPLHERHPYVRGPDVDESKIGNLEEPKHLHHSHTHALGELHASATGR